MESFASDRNEALGIYITFNPYLTTSAYELWYEDLTGNGKLYKVSPESLEKYSSKSDDASWGIYPNTPEFMDPNNEAMEYLYKTMEVGKPLWFDPYKELGLDVTAISYVMPIVIDNTMVGVVGMDLNFENIQKNDTGNAGLS